METYDVPDSGYPEEQPPGTAEDDTGSDAGTSDAEESAKPDKSAQRAPDNDDGQATGGG